ncbi:dihydropteroate synthase [Streptomyces radiopugnans]|uniref:dihydropteroate synthase n=1 Tax=Streptomyces radiopugnans TaxID=403935 RepID=UPI003F1DDA43
MDFLLGNQRLNLDHRALVMGILNRTRDSFYDGDAHYRLDDLLRRAEQMVEEGADLLDVGARPGGVGVREVTEAEETDLAASTVEALRQRFDVPVSVDTQRAAVAAEAYRTGAVLGNDMSGFADPGYLPAAAAAGASVVATHIRLPPGVPDPDPHYDDLVPEVTRRLRELATRAKEAGVPAEAILLDPGLDLGKTWRQSLALLARFDTFAALGHPLLAAPSNKIFLGRLLHRGTTERGPATIAACALAVRAGARVVRVHHVRAARDAVDLATALAAESAADGGTEAPVTGHGTAPG